jgi:hypothetical protein
VEMDDYCIMAHMLLHEFYSKQGDSAAALQEKEKIFLYNPEMLEPR